MNVCMYSICVKRSHLITFLSLWIRRNEVAEVSVNWNRKPGKSVQFPLLLLPVEYWGCGAKTFLICLFYEGCSLLSCFIFISSLERKIFVNQKAYTSQYVHVPMSDWGASSLHIFFCVPLMCLSGICGGAKHENNNAITTSQPLTLTRQDLLVTTTPVHTGT